MIYAYVSRPSLNADWYVEALEAKDLETAHAEYKKKRLLHNTHLSRMLVGASSLEAIEKAYSEKIY